MEIVSGRTGKPHVTSQQFRQIIEGIVGDGSCILPSGENLEPELVSNNSLKIRSGMMCHHGNVSSVKIGTYDEVELTNGSQGMKRIDLVVNRYTRNEEDNTEKNEWIVIMGTPAESNPTVPEYTKGNLQEGDLVDDCPAFEVHFDGINITEVTKMQEIAQTNKDLSKLLDYDPTEKTYFENGWTMKYRHISHNQVYVTLQNTNTGATGSIPNHLIMAGVPLQILFEQFIPVKMVVGSTIVGYGSITFSGKGAYLQSVAYGNSVSWVGYGVVTVE
ncbi:MAG: hypothetical protein Q3X96_07320 [Dorea sp.]|nr:hypothetical protein [Dorea sp.]